MSIRSTHSRVVIPLECKKRINFCTRVTISRERKNCGQFKAPGQDGWVGLFEGDGGEAELLELVPLHALSKSSQELANLSWLEPSADESSMMVQIIFKFGLSPSLVTPV